MARAADIPEEALDTYWLCVWRNLVEFYWDYIRTPDEENDPYYFKGSCSKPHCTFASLRIDKCRPKADIDNEVADLARDFWKRNRSDLKEHFINFTCHMWPDHDVYEAQKAVEGTDWLDFGADPSYPNRRTENNENDARHLASIGVLQRLLAKAMSKAKCDKAGHDLKALWDKTREDKAKLKEDKKRIRREKLDKCKKLVSSLFHGLF